MAYIESDVTPGYKTQGRPGLESSSVVSDSRTNNKFYEIEPAEIVDVIYSTDHKHYQSRDDIGKARFRFIHSETNTKEKDLSWASPINQDRIKTPVKHEVVLIARYLKKYYILDSLDIKLNANNNVYREASITQAPADNNYEEASTGLGKTDTRGPEEEVSITKNVKPLRPFKGDVIKQGRFGQSIRFGSASEGAATVLIRAGQNKETDNDFVVEDINRDPTSLYLTEAGALNVEYASNNIDQQFSTISAPGQLGGAQLIGASDRVLLNAKSDEMLLFSKKSTLISSAKDIGLESKGNLKQRVGADKYSYVEGKETHDIDGQISWNVDQYFIGSEDATEPLVMGNRFKKLIQKMIEFDRFHTHPSSTGPTGPPDSIPTNKTMSDLAQSLIEPSLSQHAFVSGNGQAKSKGPRTEGGSGGSGNSSDPLTGTGIKAGAPYEERVRVSSPSGGVTNTREINEDNEKEELASSEHQKLGNCPQSVSISDRDDFNISQNFRYSQLIDSCTARENRLNNDATQADIRRMRRLANNILEPIEDRFGPVGINSGHRSDVVNGAVGGSDTSQHRLGEAADIEVPSVGNKQAFMWIVNQSGLAFDQLIYEFGGSWIHISYREGRNRMEILEAYADSSGRTQYASIPRGDIASGDFG